MAKYVYIVEISELNENSGLFKEPHQIEYFASKKHALYYIESMIQINQGFDVKENSIDDIMTCMDYVYDLTYKLDNHKQSKFNLELPHRIIITSIRIRKIKLMYT